MPDDSELPTPPEGFPVPPLDDRGPFAREGWPSWLVVPGEQDEPRRASDPCIPLGEPVSLPDTETGPPPKYLDTISGAVTTADPDQPPPTDFEG
ncbi:hypothetical protein [Kutzneria buriramensis]|uniref:Uncharacterized protein n=1 Tax=Kutzneria buriramensis TaxID=1045776 RepID=A0A3E0HGB2_9PSEU|nr:hypothetical protein [Kutzneria buriramensis]REH44759.1 hypothetical protein BCF44_108239 [Kutzneria buriramensis]